MSIPALRLATSQFAKWCLLVSARRLGGAGETRTAGLIFTQGQDRFLDHATRMPDPIAYAGSAFPPSVTDVHVYARPAAT